jgi:hypothetical protein
MLFPISRAVGVDPVHYGIVIVAAMGIAFFLPPIGVGLSIASGIARVDVDEVSRSYLPYLAVLLVGLALIAAGGADARAAARAARLSRLTIARQGATRRVAESNSPPTYSSARTERPFFTTKRTRSSSPTAKVAPPRNANGSVGPDSPSSATMRVASGAGLITAAP